MLFNSYEFIFAFLPVTLAGFFAIGIVSRTAALRWIIFVSLVFYALWRPLNVAAYRTVDLDKLRVGSDRCSDWRGRKAISSLRLVLLLGIAFNVAFLGYFKYIDFGTKYNQRHIRHQSCLDARNSTLGNLLHHVSENRVPDRRPRRARKVIHSSGLLPVRIVFSRNSSRDPLCITAR